MSQKDNQRAKPAPITAHRAFPAIVALWFAALMGIGSLVVPPEKLSAVVSALGIPKVIPAAAPPLGFTARALLALMMAGLGVVIGLALGLRIARRSQVQPVRRTDPTKGRQEKSKRTHAYKPAEPQVEPEPEAVEELPVRSRGPLRASEAFAHIEPLTDAPAASVVADAEAPADDHFAVLGAPQAEHDPFDMHLATFAQESPGITGETGFDTAPETTMAAPGPFATLDAADAPEPVVETNFDAPGAQPAHPETVAAEPVIIPPKTVLGHSAREAIAQADVAELGTVQLVERLALAMARRMRGAEPAPVLATIESHEGRSPAHEEPLDLAIEAALPEAIDPDEESRQPRLASATEPAREVDAPAHDHAAGYVQPVARPAILSPVAHAWDDEDEDDDTNQVAPPRFLSTRQAPAGSESEPVSKASAPQPFGKPEEPKRAADAEEDESAAEADPASEDRYPSLLDIQPVMRAPIHIAATEPVAPVREVEPVVVFPGSGPRADAPFAPPPASTLQSRRNLAFHGPAGGVVGVPVTPPELPADPVDADEADRALRAALATLQRMSGGR